MGNAGPLIAASWGLHFCLAGHLLDGLSIRAPRLSWASVICCRFEEISTYPWSIECRPLGQTLSPGIHAGKDGDTFYNSPTAMANSFCPCGTPFEGAQDEEDRTSRRAGADRFQCAGSGR